MNSNLNNHQGARYGWSTYSLTSLVLLLGLSLPALAIASDSSPSSQLPVSFFSSSDTVKLLIAVLALVGVPLIRSIWSKYQEKQAFRVFLKAHTKNAQGSFGEESSVDFVRDNLGISGNWLELLANHNLGVPAIFIGIHDAIQHTLTDEAHGMGYNPFVSYLGVNNEYAPLDHDSVIWQLAKNETKATANYFISQEQVLSGLKSQYSSPFFELIKSDHAHHRKQWCSGLEASLQDMAEHYVNLIQLRKVLD